MARTSYPELWSFAERHAGAFDREAARSSGLSTKQVRSRVQAGEWAELLPGVFRSSATPRSMSMLEHASLLYLGPASFLSHESGAARWNLVRRPLGVTASVPAAVNPWTPAWLTVVRTRHPECVETGGIRVAEPARAMADLAMVYGQGELAAALAAGVQSGRVSVDDVRRQSLRLRGRPGGLDLTAVLAEFDPAFESVLGREMCDLLRDAGVTDFYPGDRIDLPGGGYRCGDAVIRDLRLNFEADGFAYHGTKAQQQADKKRDRELGLALYRTVRFTTDDIRRRRAETVAAIPPIVAARAREIGLYAHR